MFLLGARVANAECGGGTGAYLEPTALTGTVVGEGRASMFRAAGGMRHRGCDVGVRAGVVFEAMNVGHYGAGGEIEVGGDRFGLRIGVVRGP